MGCWGPGIFEDDFALDVRDIYDELIQKGYKDNQVTAKVFELFEESIKDEDDSIIVFTAIAAIQLSRSSLLQEVKERTITLIERESGMTRWKESGKASYKDRRNELEKLKRILSIANAIPTDSLEHNASNMDEYNESILYTVYQITDKTGNAVFVGTTAFPEKRFRYMNYVGFKKNLAKEVSSVY